MCVVGLKEFEVADVGLVEQLIAHGTAARCVGSTGANAESAGRTPSCVCAQKVRGGRIGSGSGGASESGSGASRSRVRRRAAFENKAGANHETIHGKFSFIDLAGSSASARTSKTTARPSGWKAPEIQQRSLLALKECIRRALDSEN